MKKLFKRQALQLLSVIVIASLFISMLSVGFMYALADDTQTTGWSYWGTATVTGNETDGYSLTRGGPFFAVSDTTYDVTKKALSFKIVDPTTDLMWFSVSKADVSNKELYPEGDGAEVSRVSFFIRKLNDTQARITYCRGYEGSIESNNHSVIVDYDWDIAHTYSVRKTTGDNWYLFLDENQITVTTQTNILNEFMNANSDEMLHYGLGSQYGASFTEVKAVDYVNDFVAQDSWSYLYPHNGNITGALEGNDENGYSISNTSRTFALSDKKYDVSKYAVSLKLNSPVDKSSANGYFWFALSRTHVEDNKIDYAGKAEDVGRITFIIWPEYSGDTTKTRFSYWNFSANIEIPIATVDKLDWAAEHTFGVAKNTDGKWYFTVDGEMLENALSDALCEYLDTYGTELHFGVGGQKKFDGEKIKVVDLAELERENSWSYFSSNSVSGSLDGNDSDGYTVASEKPLYAISDKTYDISQNAASIKLDKANGFFWFSITKTGIEDQGVTQTGAATDIGRAIFIVHTNYNNLGQTRFSYWNPNGTGGERPIWTGNFDWSVEHTFTVTKNADGNWYLTIDSAQYTDATSVVLNAFMDLNNPDGTLRYGFGGQNGLTAEKINVVALNGGKDEESNKEGWGYWTSNSTGKLDGNEQDGYNVNSEVGLFAISDKSYYVAENSLSLKLNSSDSWNGDGWFWLAVSKTDSTDIEKFQLGAAADINRMCVLVHTNYNNSGQTRFSHINAYGNGTMTEKPIWTGDFDWSVEHSFCVSQAANGHWYWTVDGEQLTGAQSNVLDDFMNLYAEDGLRYGLGGQSKLSAENIKVIETGSVIKPGGWNYWATDGVGKLEGSDEDGYFVNSETPLYAITDYTYTINENAVSLKLNTSNSTGGDGFFWFSITKSGIEDTSVTQYGDVENINRMVFIVHTNYNGTGQTRFSYWNTDSGATEKPIWTNSLDWSKQHTLSVTPNADGHWYLTLDGMQLTGAESKNLDAFMELYGKTDTLHYGIGGQNRFSAENIKIVPLTEIDEPEGWKYRSSRGNGEFSGNSEEGFSEYLADGQIFAYTKKTYDVSKTAIEFEVTDVRDWLYFGISVTDRSDTSPFPNGSSAGEINRFIFIITPTDGGNSARCSIWNPADYSEEQIKTISGFNWYTTHTLDVRQGEGGGWYLCIDGIILMNKNSIILNEFVNMHNSKGELRYALGGSGCFGVQGVKITEKPPLKTASESGGSAASGVTDWGQLDFEFTNDNNINDFDDDLSFEFNDGKNEESGIPEMLEVRVKKRKLVQKGHGIIFNTWEIIGMIAGGVAVLGGIVFLIIFLIKRRKKRKTA